MPLVKNSRQVTLKKISHLTVRSSTCLDNNHAESAGITRSDIIVVEDLQKSKTLSATINRSSHLVKFPFSFLYVKVVMAHFWLISVNL